MSGQSFLVSGKRRAVAAVLFGVTIVAIVAAVLFKSFHPKPAFGAGAGICTPNTPVCTEQGNSAYATFDSVSSDGCTFTQVYVQPATDLAQPGSNDVQSVFVFITKYDQCNNEVIEQGTNDIGATNVSPFTGAITFGANLSTGSLDGTAPIYDIYTGNLLFTASIHVTWQGYGSITKNLDSEHFFSQNIVMNMHINGTSRNAEASGSFTDETGSNVIIDPSLDATMFNSTGSQVMIFLSN